MTISPAPSDLPEEQRQSGDSSTTFDDVSSSHDDRSMSDTPNRRAAFSNTEHSWVTGLFGSWGTTMRVATLVGIVLAMVVLALWLLPIEVSFGPVEIRR